MKNLVFFLFAISLFVTSCTNEVLTPVEDMSSVVSRTAGTEITAQVASYEIIIEDVVFQFVMPDEGLDGLTPASTQTLIFE